MSTQTITAYLQPDFSRAPLPRGLRELAADMSWDGFLAAYGHSAGPVTLTQWNGAAPRCVGPQLCDYQATLDFGGRTRVTSASASGPIAALSTMLYEHGFGFEVLNFHQLQMGRDTVTFIRGTAGTRDDWAMAWSEDATLSALRAVVACANRLSA